VSLGLGLGLGCLSLDYIAVYTYKIANDRLVVAKLTNVKKMF